MNAATELRELVAKVRHQIKRRMDQGQGAWRVRLDAPLAAPQSDDLPLDGKAFQSGVIGGRKPAPPWAADLFAFEEQIRACERCPLGKSRRNFVFGEGRRDARLMFVGEAPGADEDAQGRPFVGAAGQLLTRIIQAMGFNRDEVYIANLLKCRPPRNRDPEPAEVEACRPYVEHQIGLVRPQAMVALGRFAAQTLLKTSTGITRLRGQWQDFKGIPVMPTFHPSALLRDPRLKRHVWDDMKLVMQKLEHP